MVPALGLKPSPSPAGFYKRMIRLALALRPQRVTTFVHRDANNQMASNPEVVSAGLEVQRPGGDDEKPSAGGSCATLTADDGW